MRARGRIRAAAALLLALAVVFGAVGCGGGSDQLSKTQYENKLKGIGTDLQTSFNAIQGQGNNIGAIETKVSQAQTKLQQAANEVKGLKAPKDAQADNTKLGNALAGLAGAMNSFKQALASKNISKIQQEAKSFQTSPSIADAKAAVDDLKKKGYSIGVLGS
jgi:chromosome segregation ATPase